MYFMGKFLIPYHYNSASVSPIKIRLMVNFLLRTFTTCKIWSVEGLAGFWTSAELSCFPSVLMKNKWFLIGINFSLLYFIFPLRYSVIVKYSSYIRPTFFSTVCAHPMIIIVDLDRIIWPVICTIHDSSKPSDPWGKWIDLSGVKVAVGDLFGNVEIPIIPIFSPKFPFQWK